MRYTEDLMTEHRAIERLLVVLESMSARLERGERIPPANMSDVVEFIAVFADKCHHGKEEGLLFPAMEAAGVPREGGPIGQMLEEHATGRAFVAEMRHASETYAGDPAAGAEFASGARGYAELLRAHIAKEDSVLYPMADKFLPVAVKMDLAEQFDGVERDVIGEGRHEAFHAMLERMESDYAA